MSERPSPNALDPFHAAVTRYFLSLRDAASGGFRFAAAAPVTLMGTSYAVLGLEAAGALAAVPEAVGEAAVSFLLAARRRDGSFRDPLFRSEDVAHKAQGAAFFFDETTAFCRQALDALGRPTGPRYRAAYGDRRAAARLAELPWTRPWTDANRALFLLSELCHDALRHDDVRLLEELDEALDFLASRHDPATGFWAGPHPRTETMAATCHFAFFYAFRGRALPYAERVVDACLALERPQGLFCDGYVGHSCFDYDALVLLTFAGAGHRAVEVARARARAARELRALANSDGGFAHRKLRVRRPFGVALPRALAARERGAFENGWPALAAPAAASNAFSTWFRTLALGLAEGPILSFRTLPFLGYHPWGRG